MPDDGASSEYARINYSGDVRGPLETYYIFDFRSKNYTFVNSKRIKYLEAHDGDKIQIGNTVLKFVVLGKIETTFHAEARDRITQDQLTGPLTSRPSTSPWQGN